MIHKTASGKYQVKTADGSRVLGTHSSYEKALAQLRAVEANKHRHVRGHGGRD